MDVDKQRVAFISIAASVSCEERSEGVFQTMQEQDWNSVEKMFNLEGSQNLVDLDDESESETRIGATYGWDQLPGDEEEMDNVESFFQWSAASQ